MRKSNRRNPCYEWECTGGGTEVHTKSLWTAHVMQIVSTAVHLHFITLPIKMPNKRYLIGTAEPIIRIQFVQLLHFSTAPLWKIISSIIIIVAAWNLLAILRLLYCRWQTQSTVTVFFVVVILQVATSFVRCYLAREIVHLDWSWSISFLSMFYTHYFYNFILFYLFCFIYFICFVLSPFLFFDRNVCSPSTSMH